MIYSPITTDKKQEWIDWLQNEAGILNGKQEDKQQNQIFETPDGDIANAKDLVGKLLATLTGKNVTIN